MRWCGESLRRRSSPIRGDGRNAGPNVPDEWVNFAQQVLGPLRQSLIRDALRALEFGWAGFEKIWRIQNGRRVLARLKPLLWDCTEILVDEHGNPAGLLNRPLEGIRQPVILAAGKYFLYSLRWGSGKSVWPVAARKYSPGVVGERTDSSAAGAVHEKGLGDRRAIALSRRHEPRCGGGRAAESMAWPAGSGRGVGGTKRDVPQRVCLVERSADGV